MAVCLHFVCSVCLSVLAIGLVQAAHDRAVCVVRVAARAV